jgi:Tfp pilus assembly protein PilV
MILFFLGFVLAIGLLAYTSIQIAELQKKAESLSQNLKTRYSKPLTDLNELEKETKAKTEG